MVSLSNTTGHRTCLACISGLNQILQTPPISIATTHSIKYMNTHTHVGGATTSPGGGAPAGSGDNEQEQAQKKRKPMLTLTVDRYALFPVYGSSTCRSGNETNHSEKSGNVTRPSKRSGNENNLSKMSGNETNHSERSGNETSPPSLHELTVLDVSAPVSPESSQRRGCHTWKKSFPKSTSKAKVTRSAWHSTCNFH